MAANCDETSPFSNLIPTGLSDYSAPIQGIPQQVWCLLRQEALPANCITSKGAHLSPATAERARILLVETIIFYFFFAVGGSRPFSRR